MFSIVKNYLKENTGILIRIDDVCENMDWEKMRHLESLFKKYSIKPVIGVIPNNKDDFFFNYPRNENFWEQIRKWDKMGWEVAMHGYTHIYDRLCKKKADYFNYGGGSEFFNHPIKVQIERIRKGLEKFKKENIKIRTFFAPNQTYDENTFVALKECGINEVIDGYGLMPYEENNIKFIPQLFEKVLIFPFGIQSTKLHLQMWKKNDYDNFEKFIHKNHKNIINYDQALAKVNNGTFFHIIKFLMKYVLRLKRLGLKKDSEFNIKEN
tara:strand:- start:108 stop:908 length:801 start_codon:yes stop_codon:yes gene_type:complete